MYADFEIWKALETRQASREQLAAGLGALPREIDAAHRRFVAGLATLAPFPARVSRILLIELGIAPEDLLRPDVLADRAHELASLPRLGAVAKRAVLDFIDATAPAKAA